MQRLHEDDLVGHVQTIENWRVLKFPAIAEENESYTIQTPYGPRVFERKAGDALHPAREPLEVLDQLRHAQGKTTSPVNTNKLLATGGGLVKISWFKKYTEPICP